jgi:serine/threonine protein phosphatase 1
MVAQPPVFRSSQRARPRGPAVAADERVYAIGDIHGRLDLMIRLLARIHEDAAGRADGRRPRIVFLGDYIDRGEASRQVLDALLNLAGANSRDLIFLQGNHEAALLAFLRDPEGQPGWLSYGARATLGSLGLPVRQRGLGRADRVRLRDELAEAIAPYLGFLTALGASVRSGDVLFSHAGLDPRLPLGTQPAEAMIWGHRDFLVDQPVAGLRVVHGHYDGDRPVSRPGRVCVDTGAYYSGVLTAVCLDAGERFLAAG